MGAEVVDADFARELERENVRLREALEVAERELGRTPNSSTP
jgi:hypothetical protein